MADQQEGRSRGKQVTVNIRFVRFKSIDIFINQIVAFTTIYPNIPPDEVIKICWKPGSEKA